MGPADGGLPFLLRCCSQSKGCCILRHTAFVKEISMSSSTVGSKLGTVLITGVRDYKTSPNGTQQYRYDAVCDCGVKLIVSYYSVRNFRKNGSTMCKECLKKAQSKVSSAGHKHPLYQVWFGMVCRCYDQKCENFARYGGRGIYVCEGWLQPKNRGRSSVAGFQQFVKDMGERPGGTSLDRVDNDGPYAPWNCRWATKEEQANNTRANVRITVGATTQTLSQWCRQLGVSYAKISYAAKKHGVPFDVVVLRLQEMTDARRAKNIKWVERKRQQPKPPMTPEEIEEDRLVQAQLDRATQKILSRQNLL